jgi:hypothetical protein
MNKKRQKLQGKSGSGNWYGIRRIPLLHLSVCDTEHTVRWNDALRIQLPGPKKKFSDLHYDVWRMCRWRLK